MSAPIRPEKGTKCCFHCRYWEERDWRGASGLCRREVVIRRRPFWHPKPSAAAETYPFDGGECDGYASGRRIQPMLDDATRYCLGLRVGHRVWLRPWQRGIDPERYGMHAQVIKSSRRGIVLATPIGTFTMRAVRGLMNRPAGAMKFFPYLVLDTSKPPVRDERVGHPTKDAAKYLKKKTAGDIIPLVAWGNGAGREWSGRIVSRREGIITVKLPGNRRTMRLSALGEYAGTPLSWWEIHDGTVWSLDTRRIE